MAWTPSVSTRRRAASTPSCGSRVESASKLSTGIPSTPPAMLICRIARSKARFLSATVSEALLKLSISPILMVVETSGSSSAPLSHATKTVSKQAVTMSLTRLDITDAFQHGLQAGIIAHCGGCGNAARLALF